MLIFEKNSKNRIGYSLPKCEIETDIKIDNRYIDNDKDIMLPELSENDVIRHYTKLSLKNFGVDSGMYPLGSCTMKYNPKINELVARFEGFTNTHPLFPEKLVQGNLELMYNLKELLCEIAGFDDFTLQPAAGAHGELTGISIIKAYHKKKGNTHKNIILVPNSAHGTNPATAAMSGFKVKELKSDERGNVDLEDLKANLNDNIAGLMLTNPNTLGLWDENILEITELIHSVDGLCYYDGANLNAIMGYYRPGDMGFDICHLNLHKTFSTPHGGGGPGAGPVGVKKELAEFLPYPTIVKEQDEYKFNYDMPDSIGKVKSYYGNFAILVRAYTYIVMMGKDGLKYSSETAVLNANYIMNKLKKYYYLPYDRDCMHEFVINSKKQKEYGIKTLDIAKRLLELGYHPPTVYFPLIVEEAMMIEPTESESLETIDEFIKVMEQISTECKENTDIVKSAPTTLSIGRLDEARAAKDMKLVYKNNIGE